MSRDWRLVHQVASWCLHYPDDELLGRLPVLRGALAEQPASEPVARLDSLLLHLGRTPVADLQRHYVEVFDLNRHHAMHVSYWTDGDTRRRGQVLADLKERFRGKGFRLTDGGELPDHLPVLLEYAARVAPGDGVALLQEYRASLELLRLALLEDGTPYADVLVAVCATLPGVSPADRRAARALAAQGPPQEHVGLDYHDPRLLPIVATTSGIATTTGRGPR